jgi:transcriptional regulator with XRE-family HTH domain
MTTTDERRALIAARVREARKMAGLSQGQVARSLDMHRPSVSEIEAGNRRVSADELSKLAELFDVSIAWLTGEGSDRLDPHDAKLELAARELQRMKPEHLDRLLSILAALKEDDE